MVIYTPVFTVSWLVSRVVRGSEQVNEKNFPTPGWRWKSFVLLLAFRFVSPPPLRRLTATVQKALWIWNRFIY